MELFLHQQLRDLDGVGSGALADLIAAAPQAQAVVVRQVGTDTADEHNILIGGVQRHGVLLVFQVVHQLAAGSLGDDLPCLLHGDRHIKVAADGNGVAAHHRDTDTGAADLQLRQVHDLAAFVLHLHFFAGVALEHVIAAKAVAFGEALQPEYKEYQAQVKKNAAVMAQAFIDKGYKIISNGTDNHCMLIDLRTKFPELTGKVAEKALVAADITANKNMVPFDSRSPFQTSGIRLGTPAITTRGAKEDLMLEIVEMIDTVLKAPENDSVIKDVRKKVNETMKAYPLFAY